ncbi:MAG: hypothetical protein ABSD77_07440 [Verrucomicrobiota bacterium]
MPRTLDEQRREFAQRRGLAMPLAGAVAWTIVGVGGAFLPPIIEVWLLFGATGFIVGLGIFFSRFTGENFLDKQRPKNVFDGLFFRTVGEALLVYAIAIPFFREDYTSLPLSVLLDYRTLGWHFPHLGAHGPRDRKLVFVPPFPLHCSAGSNRCHLRSDYRCP